MIVKVHILQIPQGSTLHLEGEENPAPLGLEEAGATPLSQLQYNIEVGLSNGGIFATGWLKIKVSLTCVVTLEPFEKEILINPFCLQKELDGRELVDLTPEIRDDIHLQIPAHPRSPSADEFLRLNPTQFQV